MDFEEDTLRVIGKADKERLLPLHRRTQEAVQQYLQTWPGPRKPKAPQDLLWWTLTGQPLTKNTAQVAVERHLTRAGLSRASAHKLRHTFGTRLAEAGVDLLIIKDLLGHATVATPQIYAHVAKRRLREAITRFAWSAAPHEIGSVMAA